jgi:hypothetical protein
MFSEEISFTQNQKRNENLMDSSGFAYQKHKMMPVKDCIYWTCGMRTKFHCPATAVNTISTKLLVSQCRRPHP